jgi:uncharacterized protein
MQRLATPLTDADITRLDELLASIHAPLQPMDASAVDGYLCGILLQPVTILWRDALPSLFDADATTALPPGLPPALVAEVDALAARRLAELSQAIEARQWFDPWIFEPEDDEPLSQSQVLWVSGFSLALERWPELLRLDNPRLQEPLAVIYAALDPQDLEDADDLLAIIETLEPPTTLEEAAEDLVRSVLLLADVSRPRRDARSVRSAPAARQAPAQSLRQTGAVRAPPGPGRHSQKGRRG